MIFLLGFTARCASLELDRAVLTPSLRNLKAKLPSAL